MLKVNINQIVGPTGVRIKVRMRVSIVRAGAREKDPMSTTEAENKKIARKIPEEVFTEGKLELIDEIFADDYVSKPPSASEPLHGPEEMKEWVSRIRDAFSAIDVTIEDVIAENDKVVHRRRFNGTIDGEFMGIEATGKKIEMKSIVIIRFKDGKVVESWFQSNVLELMQQLGVFPPGPRMILRLVARKIKARFLGG